MFSKILFGGFRRERNWNSCLIFGRIELSIKYWVLILKCFPKSFSQNLFRINKQKQKKEKSRTNMIQWISLQACIYQLCQWKDSKLFSHHFPILLSGPHIILRGIAKWCEIFFLNLKLFVVGGCGECTTKFKW